VGSELKTPWISEADSLVDIGIHLFVAGAAVAGGVALFGSLLLSGLTYGDGLIFRCLGALFPVIMGFARATKSLGQLKRLSKKS
jgi:hypothetical protein